MSFIGDIFSGDKGAGYQAPFAPITSPFVTDNPLGNKNTEVFDQFGGIKNNQDALAQMLLAQAQGGGPNPAAAALQQATNANQAMTAGTIAGTKGIDPALAARQAAMAGGVQQQQGAAQGAQLRAGQQLAAQSGLQQLYGTQGQQNLQQQNIIEGAIANLNNANVANVGQKTSAESGVAKQNAATQGGVLQGITGGAMNGLGKLFAHGGQVPGTSEGPTSKIGQFLHQTFNKGGNVGSAMKAGGKVPGEAKVSGDSRENDTVKALLSPQEIVIPRSITMSPDAPKKAAEFVAAVLARDGTKGRKK